MKTPTSLAVILGISFAMAASIMAFASSAEADLFERAGLVPVPSATPKKPIKKGPKATTDLGGGDDLDGVAPAARNQSTSGSTNRTAAPSTKPAKAGKSPKAASKPVSNDYTYGTLPATNKSRHRSSNNLSGGDDPDGATPAARNQSTSGGTGRSAAPNKKPGKSTKIIWDPTQEGLKSGAKGNKNSAPSATGTNSPGGPSGTTQKKPKP